MFRELASSIVLGELAPGALLPPERLLSERFGVSKILVRQAIHRLADAGLLEVRQGGATRVLDPGQSADLQVIELYYRLAPNASAALGLRRDVLEKRFTQGLSLVEVFARRAEGAVANALVALVDEETPHDERALAMLEKRFWLRVSAGAGNRILAAEVRWWYSALPARPAPAKAPPISVRHAFYRELARRLRDGDDAVGFYLRALRPGLQALFSGKSKGVRR